MPFIPLSSGLTSLLADIGHLLANEILLLFLFDIFVEASIWREDIGNRNNRLVNLAGRNRLVILADDDDEVNDDAIIVVLI